MLHEWVQEIEKAKKDTSHPMYAFAMVAYQKSDDSGQFAEAIKSLTERAASHAAMPIQTIIDYGAPASSTSWYTDGPAFGLRPVRVGELILGQTLEHPLEGIATRGMARRDPAFNDLHAAPGTEADGGVLNTWNRSGQTLRTPNVTLKSGRLWYQVRGAGRAYAVVDSHLIIQGPLHGALLHQWHAEKNDAWVWVSQDLSAYAGQRCHVEFSPSGKGGLDIAQVIEADQPPAVDEPNALLLAALNSPAVNAVESLAVAYQQVFQGVFDRLASDHLTGGNDAELADFLVRHSSLFISPESLSQNISASAKNFIKAQAKLCAEIVNESPTAPAMLEGNGVDENLLIRGVAKNAGETVPRRFLEAISGKDQKAYHNGGKRSPATRRRHARD